MNPDQIAAEAAKEIRKRIFKTTKFLTVDNFDKLTKPIILAAIEKATPQHMNTDQIAAEARQQIKQKLIFFPPPDKVLDEVETIIQAAIDKAVAQCEVECGRFIRKQSRAVNASDVPGLYYRVIGVNEPIQEGDISLMRSHDMVLRPVEISAAPPTANEPSWTRETVEFMLGQVDGKKLIADAHTRAAHASESPYPDVIREKISPSEQNKENKQ